MKASSSNSWLSSSSTSSSPCAACKYQRRKCKADCIFAPYFPPNERVKFEQVHHIFGASNVARILTRLQPQEREEAVKSLAFEADARLRDPINGTLGVISNLRHKVSLLEMQLYRSNMELVRRQNYFRAVVDGPLATVNNNNNNVDFGRGGASNHYSSQQQQQRMPVCNIDRGKRMYSEEKEYFQHTNKSSFPCFPKQ